MKKFNIKLYHILLPISCIAFCLTELEGAEFVRYIAIYSLTIGVYSKIEEVIKNI